jgi:hypothetical protein
MAGVIVKESNIHGIGAFAARDFAAGEIILAIDDSRIVDAEHPLLPELVSMTTCDYLAGGKTVLMRSPERHINSCCNPNTQNKNLS